jgi:hypothetical protein
MRILVPYVRLHPRTKVVVAREASEAVFALTDGPTGYWDVLAENWDRRRSFIVLEQDKVPEPGLLRELWECPEPWCSARAAMRGTDEPAAYPSLSCVKFAGSLMVTYPRLLEDVGELDLGLGEKEWSRLDLAIAGLLSNVAEVHWHDGRVEHLHEEAVAVA